MLLPYGTVPSQSRITALRFAYRLSTSATNLQRRDPRSHTVWIDAATGDLLKYVGDSAADTAVTQKIWCRDPIAGGICQVSAPLTVFDGKPRYIQARMALDHASVQSWDATNPSLSTLPGASMACAAGQAQARGANVFFSVHKALGTVRSAGRFTDFEHPLKIGLDDPGNQNVASFDEMTLKFTRGKAVGYDCRHESEDLAGSTDGTIIAHEVAHLVTMQLQTMESRSRCDRDDCPSTNPYNRSFFHDYADGYSSILSGSPCIGGWSQKNVGRTVAASSLTEQQELAASCGRHVPGSALPRLLFAERESGNVFQEKPAFDLSQQATRALEASEPPFIVTALENARVDSFPLRREPSREEYGDGQIVGAALWHLREGMFSLGEEGGIASLLSNLNEAIWATGFSPTACPAERLECDANVYRSGRELLHHLLDSWMASEAKYAANKVLSAFARAGIFLVPVDCLDGQWNIPDETPDKRFCPNGDMGADAIIDIKRGIGSAPRSLQGINFPQDDVWAKGWNGLVTFQVWTGPNTTFKPVKDDVGGPPSLTPPCATTSSRYFIESGRSARAIHSTKAGRRWAARIRHRTARGPEHST